MTKIMGVPIMLNLPISINDRLMKQMERMSTSKSMLIRMGVTKLLEELEASETGGRDGKKKVSRDL
jgi:hypothetical protein